MQRCFNVVVIDVDIVPTIQRCNSVINRVQFRRLYSMFVLYNYDTYV